MSTRKRCAWAGNDPLMQAYHDEEWGVPQHDSRMLWEMLMLEGFQAGLAWITVLRKREAFRRAFAGFDPKKVARFGDTDVERLMADAGIIRGRAKIEATIRGARSETRRAWKSGLRSGEFLPPPPGEGWGEGTRQVCVPAGCAAYGAILSESKPKRRVQGRKLRKLWHGCQDNVAVNAIAHERA